MATAMVLNEVTAEVVVDRTMYESRNGMAQIRRRKIFGPR